MESAILMIYQHLPRDKRFHEQNVWKKLLQLRNYSSSSSNLVCAYREDDLAFLFIAKEPDLFDRLYNILYDYHDRSGHRYKSLHTMSSQVGKEGDEMKATDDDAEIDSVLRTGMYKDKKTLLHDAIKALFITKPNLRYEIAIDRYRNKEVTLWKAAETAGLTIEEFKELLNSRGIKIGVSSTEEESNRRLEKVFHGR